MRYSGTSEGSDPLAPGETLRVRCDFSSLTHPLRNTGAGAYNPYETSSGVDTDWGISVHHVAQTGLLQEKLHGTELYGTAER